MDFQTKKFEDFNKMKRIFLIILLSLVTFQVTFSQEGKANDGHYNKNAIYGSLSFPMFYYLLNYDRQIIRINKDKIALNMSFSYGGFSNLGAVGKTINLCSNIIFGENKHHFETDIGIAFNRVHASQGKPPPPIGPCVNIGYRIQQKHKPFVLRTGISIPQGIFLSIGFAF
jgi:hypothetical protein